MTGVGGCGLAVAGVVVVLLTSATLGLAASGPDSGGSCVTATTDPSPLCPDSSTRLNTPTSASDRATSVVTHGDRVYVTGVSTSSQVVTLALDAAAGHTVWAASAPGRNGRFDVALVAVSGDGSEVYTAVPDSSGVDVYAYNASTGAQLWSTVQPNPLPPVGSGQPTSEPLHLDAVSAGVIATVDNSGTLGVTEYGASASAGQSVTLWSYTALPTSPALRPLGAAIAADGSTLYVAGVGGTAQQPTWSVLAIETTHGTQVWAVAPAGTAAEGIAASPDGHSVLVTGIANYTDIRTDLLQASTGAVSWTVDEHFPPTNGQQALAAGSAALFSADSNIAIIGGYDDAFYDQQHFHKTYPLRAYTTGAGASVWSATLPGPDNYGDPDIRLALSVDGSTVAATTRAAAPNNGYAFATYGVAPATGSQLWVTEYNGPIGGDNAPKALAASSSGFVVAGYSEGGATLADYLTQSLDTGGNQLWTSRYDESAAPFDEVYASTMSRDGATEYMTGLASDGEDSAGNSIIDSMTVAIDVATGTERWRRLWHPAGGTDGSTFAIAASPTGTQVFVTGQSTAAPGMPERLTVLALDAATGAVQWTVVPGGDQGRGAAVSPDGTTVYIDGYVTDNSGLGFIVLALDASSGAQRWMTQYNVPVSVATTTDVPYGIALSRDGSQVAITGTSFDATTSNGSATTLDLRTVDGSTRFASTYSGMAAVETDETFAIGFDPDGSSLFVSGDANVNQGTRRYLTVAYDTTTGAQRWAETFSNGTTDAASALAVAPSGSSVYVTGASVSATPQANEDYATIAYDATTGAQQWITRYSTPNNDLAERIAVSPDGSRIYVAGESQSLTTGANDVLLAVYNAAGTALSTARWDDGQANDEVHGLDVSPDASRVIVVSRVAPASGGMDYLALDYVVRTPQTVVPELPGGAGAVGFGSALIAVYSVRKCRRAAPRTPAQDQKGRCC
ncbi:MAG: hypothetical protein JOY80_05720 [Candidatus Dormibacteraeota bacterium]|nr:hypothetical protein [Candidatus Dormibacteraeota bacterium]